jgi:hypothetical protein
MLASPRVGMDHEEPLETAPASHPHLRLVWSRPADLPPLPPRRPVNLAVAIERHLQGADGFSDEQFAAMYARPRAADATS